MAFWLFKTEPSAYSWEQLERDQSTVWTGIRNAQARNYLKQVKVGDSVFIYHTGEDKMIMGVAEITSEPFPDPTATKGEWVAVRVRPRAVLQRVVSLDEIRNTYGLSVMPLVTQPRLSVQPVTDDQARMILKIAKTDLSL